MEAGLTVDVVLLQPPLKLCSVEIWKLKRVMKINQFLNYFPIHWQFAWKSNFLNFKNKILTFIHWWEGSNTAPMLYLICCKQAYFFMYRIETWTETHSVSPDWPDFCSTESWLVRHRWKDSIILDFSSSPSLFWRPFLSSSQSELQNYKSDNMKTQPTFSQFNNLNCKTTTASFNYTSATKQ